MEEWRRNIWRRILEEFRRVEAEISRMEDEFFRLMREAEERSGCITPLYNVYESGDEVRLTADLPGASKEEIGLIAGEDYLRIEAPCRSPLRGGEGRRYVLHVRLPAKIDPQSVKARYKEGVLEVIARKKITGYRIRIE
jgi:HSP20 family protein